MCKVFYVSAVYLSLLDIAVVFTDNEVKSKYRFSGIAESIH